MRILRGIHSARLSGGGPIETIRQSGKVLQHLGHEVELFSLDAPPDLDPSDYSFPVHALGTGKGGYGYSPKVVPWLLENKSRFEAIVVSGLWQYHGLAVRRAARNDPGYFVFPHGMLDPWFARQYPLKHLKKWLYWPWGEYRVLRDARAVLFTCEEERKLARDSFWLYRCREEVVNYGTAAPSGDPEIQRCLFHDKFPETRDRRCLLFLSRIHPKKGCDLLLKAFASCKPNAEWHLVMAGPDQVGWMAELQTLARQLGIENQVTWAGMLENDLKWGAFHACELFVLPSHQENFGIVVAEALACGKPVLITRAVNIWHEVECDGVGLIADDNVSSIAGRLREWMSLPAIDRNKMAGKARNAFDKRFEVTAAARNLVEVLQAQVK